jgi:hypothetical protein
MNPWKRPYLFPLFFLAAALVLGGAVMLLWNAIMPDIIGCAPLNFLQALGLLVLCRILFGGFRGRHSGGPSWKRGVEWRERWKNMSEEERAAMRERWQKRCGPHG